MNSMAQHAVPNGSGHSELPRAQLTIVSSVVVRYVPPARSWISRSASPGSVSSPLSGPSPGGRPGLRGMIDPGLSMRSMGMEVCCRGRAESYGLEKVFTSTGPRFPVMRKRGRGWISSSLMPRIRILLTLLLTISTAAVADFHIESSSNHRDVDAVGGVALRITVVNGTTAPASNVTLFYAAERASLGTLAPGESASFDVRVAFDQSYGRKYLPVSAQADIGGKTVSDFEYTPVARYRSFAVTQTGDAGAGSLRAG